MKIEIPKTTIVAYNTIEPENQAPGILRRIEIAAPITAK
jgi:hypothetical protein